MRLLQFVLLFSSTAFPEVLSFGVKGGVPLTDAFKVAAPATYTSDSKRYTIGPTVELHLPFRLSVEFDALYRPLKYGLSPAAGDGGTMGAATADGSSWAFPLLLKYRVSGGPVRPYLDAGIAFRHLSGLRQITTLASGPSESRNSAGVVLGAGLELRAPFLRVAPEIRYTRWGSKDFPSALAGLSSQLNQAEFLVGITF